MNDALAGRAPRRPLSRRDLVIAGVVGMIVLVAFLAGYLPRRHAHSQAAAVSTALAAPPRVTVARAVAAASGRELTLPASLVANQRTLVYARASGYVRRWLVDIGAHVRAGQTLVGLETPELNQQLAQARSAVGQKVAALAQARANRDYAHLTAERYDTLLAQKLVSKQDDDQARLQAAIWDANVNAAIADLSAQRANVRQLEEMVAFGNVVAPFDGTITQRLIDVGSLVNAGAGTSTAALFEIEATNPMRAFIQVPQTFAPSVNVGQSARITLRQFPGRTFAGVVARTAGALDPATRTLRTEIDVPNEKGELLAGMYAEVTLALAVAHRVVQVPSSAILFDAHGVRVAVVGADSRVHLVAVQAGRDNGNTVELVAGLAGGEQVIATPPADVTDGQLVQAAEQPGR